MRFCCGHYIDVYPLFSWLGGFVRPLLVLASLLAPPSLARDESSIGARIYQKQCVNCHGALDASNEPFYPALVERSRRLQPDAFAEVVLRGRLRWSLDFSGSGGPNMPAHDYLSNEEIAAVVGYIYRQAGQDAADLSIEAVAATRAALVGEKPHEDIALSRLEYEAAERLYLDHCAGCHGLQRQGLSGSKIDPESFEGRSSQSIMQSIHYGSPWGMPNWGTSEQLAAEQMSLLARFLKVGVRRAPRFGLDLVQDSWRQIVEPKERPKRRQYELQTNDLFISLLHDTGQIALIDAERYSINSWIDTDLAPHAIDLTADGRYLYVLARGGQVAMIDLFMPVPKVVARVRAAYTARSIAVSNSRRQPVVAVGGHSTAQVALFAGKTLEPLGVVRLDAEEIWRPGSAIVDIHPVGNEQRFLIVARGQPGVYELELGKDGRKQRLRFHSISRTMQLGASAFEGSGRYLLLPTSGSEVIVFDSKRRTVTARVPLDGFSRGATRGVAHTDPVYGAAWALASADSATLAVIGTDPRKRPQQAWKVIRQSNLPQGGTLHLTAHDHAPELWLDLTLNGHAGVASSVLAVGRAKDAGEPTRIELRSAVAGDAGLAKAIQPQFDPAGERVWITLWNRQDLPAALVVIDASTQQIIKTIADPRLITPIRTYSAAVIQNER